MESIDGPELSALYHPNTLTALIRHNWRLGLVGYFSVVSGPFMTSWLVQAHSSDRGVVKGVVTQSSLMDGREDATDPPSSPRDPAVTLHFSTSGPLGAPPPSLCVRGVTRSRMQAAQRGFTTSGNDNNIYIQDPAMYLQIIARSWRKRNHLPYCVMRVCVILMYSNLSPEITVYFPGLLHHNLFIYNPHASYFTA